MYRVNSSSWSKCLVLCYIFLPSLLFCYTLDTWWLGINPLFYQFDTIPHIVHTHTHPLQRTQVATLTSFLELMASIIFTERKTYQAAIFWIGYITGGDQNDPRSTMVLGARRTGKPPWGSQSLTNRQVHVGILNRSKINYGCRSKKYGQSTLGLLIACKSKSACRYSQSIRDQIWS